MGTFQGSPKNGFTENITLCCMVLKIDPGFFNKNWGGTTFKTMQGILLLHFFLPPESPQEKNKTQWKKI